MVAKGVSREDIVDYLQHYILGVGAEDVELQQTAFNLVALNASANELNHSATPNVKHVLQKTATGALCYAHIALRPIEVGEELVQDYADYHFPDWLLTGFCVKNDISDPRTICQDATNDKVRFDSLKSNS